MLFYNASPVSSAQKTHHRQEKRERHGKGPLLHLTIILVIIMILELQSWRHGSLSPTFDKEAQWGNWTLHLWLRSHINHSAIQQLILSWLCHREPLKYYRFGNLKERITKLLYFFHISSSKVPLSNCWKQNRLFDRLPANSLAAVMERVFSSQ